MTTPHVYTRFQVSPSSLHSTDLPTSSPCIQAMSPFIDVTTLAAPTPLRPTTTTMSTDVPTILACEWPLACFDTSSLHMLAMHIVQHSDWICDASVLVALHMTAALAWRVTHVPAQLGSSPATVLFALLYLALAAVGRANYVACVRAHGSDEATYASAGADISWPPSLCAAGIPNSRTLAMLEAHCWRACGCMMPAAPPASHFIQHLVPYTVAKFNQLVFVMCKQIQ